MPSEGGTVIISCIYGSNARIKQGGADQYRVAGTFGFLVPYMHGNIKLIFTNTGTIVESFKTGIIIFDELITNKNDWLFTDIPVDNCCDAIKHVVPFLVSDAFIKVMYRLIS